eukprot:5542557-Amphidinium_carterae.2
MSMHAPICVPLMKTGLLGTVQDLPRKLRRIVQLWDGVAPRAQRFAEEAFLAIRAVAQVGSPADCGECGSSETTY